MIPNGPLANGTIINFTSEGRLRVDLTVGVSYNADIEQARRVLLEVLEADDRVLSDPAPMVEVAELGGSSVNLTVRPHTHPDNYWAVYFDTLKNCKLALDKAGISIPFPQRDVHLFRKSG